MIKLGVPLHIDWMGGTSTAVYLDRISSLGVQAVEIQLPPTLTVDMLSAWITLAQAAVVRNFAIAIHAPLPATHAAWPIIRKWFDEMPSSAFTLIIHGCAAARMQPALIDQTANFVRTILEQMPPHVSVAVEQGWNTGAHGVGQQVQHHMQRLIRRASSRPMGVGSGMGAGFIPQRLEAQDSPDPVVRVPWRQRHGYSGTGTREQTLRIVERVNDNRCTIAWDLAHDWLGGSRGGVRDWRTLPPPAYLRRIGYVRVHDVDDQGADHQPLVTGNVPYTSQLRTLLQQRFTGTVCLAIRYTDQARAFGSRWHMLERSIAVARQALRITTG